MLPAPVDYESNGAGICSVRYGEYMVSIERTLPVLREAANNCPACMMAAMRLSGNPVPVFSGFHFKNEMQALFTEANEERRSVIGGYY